MRLPPRCALKVDIRKAYDTVEWDFLLAVLQLFGFPQTFTKWIEECVTTASFSIGLNGNPHGFFAGARGLRQGHYPPIFLFSLWKYCIWDFCNSSSRICNSLTIGNVSRLKYSSWDSLMTSCFSVELTWTLSESSRWDWIDLQNGLDFG